MLPLGVSNTSCTPRLGVPPSQRRSDAPKGAMKCFACGNPSGLNGVGLEDHQAGPERVSLCPMCHCCVHLDFAGQLGAGRMVWLPEIPQKVLNNLALAYFLASRQLESDLENDDLRKYVTSARELFQGIERRGESVESVLAHGDKSLMKDERDPRKAGIQRHKRRQLSDPAFFAGLILHARKSTGMASAAIAKQLDGVRFLPNIDAFDVYVGQVLECLPASAGPAGWLQQGTLILASRAQSFGEQEETHFSGESEIDAGGSAGEGPVPSDDRLMV